MTFLQKDKLEWHPDEDLLMSEETSADSIQSYFRQLAGISNLHCCCMTSAVGEPDMLEMVQLHVTTCAETQRSRPSIVAATAPDHGDGKSNFSTCVAYLPVSRHGASLPRSGTNERTMLPMHMAWLERCQNLSKVHKPTHNQMPCNSPRTLSRKQDDETEERLLAIPPSTSWRRNITFDVI